MKNNLKAIQSNNNSSHNKAIFAVLVVVAVLLAAAIGLSFSDLLFPVSTAPTDSEYAGASLGGMGTSLTLGNQTNCTDSDGGANIYLKGITRAPKMNLNKTGCVYYNSTWICTDFCKSRSWLREFYCLKDECRYTEYNCLAYNLSCSNGACFNVSNEIYGEARAEMDVASSLCYEVCMIKYNNKDYCWDACYFPQGV